MHDNRMISAGYPQAWSDGGGNDQGHTSPYLNAQSTMSSLRSRTPSPTPPSSRPKSSPARHSRVRFQERPKTAAVMTGCERLQRVVHEPTRAHKLENHLRLQKAKPAPWQRTLDPVENKSTALRGYITKQGPMITYQRGPGYVMQKSKSKVTMKIQMDDFFEPVITEQEKQKKRKESEFDSFIQQLQQQILDLSLYFEEEKLNHKETKRKHVEYLKDRLDDQKSQHEAEIKIIHDEHEKEMEEMRRDLQGQMDKKESEAAAKIAQMKNEIEFLQGAFDSFKTQVTIEMNDKWNAQEKELKKGFQVGLAEELNEMKRTLAREKQAEKAAMHREYNKQTQQLLKEHKREVDTLKKRYTTAASDLARLQLVDKRLEELELEHEYLKNNHKSVCKELTSVTNDLTDTKIKLLGYEENFQAKVQQVDDKYRTKIESLMTKNTELRRMYMKKCGELFDEKTVTEEKRLEKVASAKEAMQEIIKSRTKADVSIAAVDASFDSKPKIRRERPASAPGTKRESVNAKLSAGETSHIIEKRQEKDDLKYIRPETSYETRAAKTVSDEEIIQMISMAPTDNGLPSAMVSQ